MKIQILQADANVGSPYPFSFVSNADDLDIQKELCNVQGSVRIDGTVLHTGQVFRVEGMVSFTVEFCCDRCLETFERQQTVPFCEDYKRSEEGANSGEDLFYFSGDYIDLAELIRETILLSQPLSNICSSECQGLCIKCGANLNRADCGCDRHVMDPRLAALQKMLKKD